MYYFFLVFSVLWAALLKANEAPPPPPVQAAFAEPEHLLINNRILAKVGNKTLSVIDVVKRMDVLLNRSFPQYAHSKVARFQFYTTQWKNTLSQLIDTELMIADAEGMELKINEGDVRETLQERFGPNVMANLEKIGISYDEAWQMIHNEILVQRMTWYKVESKAITSVNPQDIKLAYKDYCKKNPPAQEWKYRVLSIRSKESNLASALADKAHALLAGGEDLENVYAQLQQNGQTEQESPVSVQLSSLFEVNEKSISANHKEALSQLTPLSYSAPLSQTNRVDNSAVFRIFYLKEHHTKAPPTFEKMAETLHGELVEKAIDREGSQYITKLRQKFTFDEKYVQDLTPADFQPFSLR